MAARSVSRLAARVLHRSLCRNFSESGNAVRQLSYVPSTTHSGNGWHQGSRAAVIELKTQGQLSSLPSAWGFGGSRSFSVDTAVLPELEDPRIAATIDNLLATSWVHIDHLTAQSVKEAYSLSTDDAAKEVLSTVWRAAQAVEIFAGKLASLRLELDELSGGKFGGHKVAKLSAEVQDALEAALSKYSTYLNSFEEDEEWIKKKVEMELGGVLLQVKQRVCGLDPAWSKISLLGTKGISGSYIERRALDF